jgi:hypothetical protein
MVFLVSHLSIYQLLCKQTYYLPLIVFLLIAIYLMTIMFPVLLMLDFHRNRSTFNFKQSCFHEFDIVPLLSSLNCRGTFLVGSVNIMQINRSADQ